MKLLLLVLAILLSIPIYSQISSRNSVIIAEMQNRFPLIYKAIDSTARINMFVMKSNHVDSIIMTQCRSFLTIGFMITNPERLCNVNSEIFNVLYLQAITQNHEGSITDCINKLTFDARNACLNLNWKKVLDSLVNQIGDYHISVARKTTLI